MNTFHSVINDAMLY